MRFIKLKARAKINISLDVLGKREDGYHELEMIMQTIDLYDKISLKKIKSDKIMLKTNLSFLPVDEKNLVYKVIDYMKNQYNIKEGLFVELYKVIPIAAGLAGGSADAAAAIKGMNKLFDLRLSVEEMCHIGKQFGADIPYCIIGGTALAKGIGDQITYLDDFPKCHVVVVKPVFSMSTQTVYTKLNLENIENRPNHNLLLQGIKDKDLELISDNLCNVLETVTLQIHPEIEDIKNELKELGAKGALMSGSGSSVFGLFKDRRKAEKACAVLKQKNNIRFVYKTTIYNRER